MEGPWASCGATRQRLEQKASSVFALSPDSSFGATQNAFISLPDRGLLRRFLEDRPVAPSQPSLSPMRSDSQEILLPGAYQDNLNTVAAQAYQQPPYPDNNIYDSLMLNSLMQNYDIGDIQFTNGTSEFANWFPAASNVNGPTAGLQA